MSITEQLKVSLTDRYVIEHELGAGGMATVYLAHDVKHDRKVALKVLRPELAAVIGAERFLAEIKVTANLQHPHILPLHDSGEAGSFLYYVMPYVEGETLRTKLDREKQLGIDDAIDIIENIAAALDYAHRKGVIHRDIKPENILLHDGQPLIADFGIALALSHAGGTRLTETGLSIGTPHYMSPEQAMGDRELDARSDVYSLGAMLYEMLAGDPPYTGSTAQAIVAKVITEKAPSVTVHRDTVPPHVAAAISRALAKLPADRFPGAAQFAGALRNPGFTVPQVVAVPSGAAAGSRGWRRAALGIAAVAVALGAVAAAGWMRTPAKPVVRVAIGFPEDEAPRPVPAHRLAIAPDGSRFVYIGPSDAGQQLWLREMNDLHARPLPGTENARAPFFSPDGRMVAFFTGEPGDLKTVSIDGGPPQVVVSDSANPWGGAWTDDGMLYFPIGGGPLARVPAGGGPVERISTLDSARNDREHNFPHVLPNGKGAIVQVYRGSVATTDIGVLDFATGTVGLLTPGVYARFVPPDRLVYGTPDGTVLAAPFDPDAMELAGAGVALLEGVRIESFSISSQFALSASGTLLYQSGSGAGSEYLVWVGMDGAIQFVDSTWSADFSSLAVAPDGRRAAVSMFTDGDQGLWVKQLDDGPLTRLTFSGTTNYRPAWTPDGRSIAFVSDRENGNQLWIKRADGSAPAELLLSDPRQIDEVGWTRDGQWLFYRTGSGGLRSRDLYAIRPGVDSVPTVLADTPFDEYSPAVSPDGRWLAYTSNESDQPEVFVRPFPDASRAKWQVSVRGGSEPVWAPDGRRLFYRTRRGDMVAVAIPAGPTFSPGIPTVLFTAPDLLSEVFHPLYGVSPDGRRFLMLRQEAGAENEFVLVLNWIEEVRDRLGG